MYTQQRTHTGYSTTTSVHKVIANRAHGAACELWLCSVSGLGAGWVGLEVLHSDFWMVRPPFTPDTETVPKTDKFLHTTESFGDRRRPSFVQPHLACSCHQRPSLWLLLPWWPCTSPVGNDTTISSTTSRGMITFCCSVDVVVLRRLPHEAAAVVGQLAWRRRCLLDAPLHLLARVHARGAADHRGMVSLATTSTRRCDVLQHVR